MNLVCCTRAVNAGDVVGPRRARIIVSPAVLRAASTATLTCQTDTANPPARLSWWTTTGDGRPESRLVSVTERQRRTAAEQGGSVVQSRVEVELSADDHLKTVACVANGTRTATGLVELRVRCEFVTVIT